VVTSFRPIWIIYRQAAQTKLPDAGNRAQNHKINAPQFEFVKAGKRGSPTENAWLRILNKQAAILAVSMAIWPLAAQAQQPERMRRVGVLMNRAASDPEGQARVAAFKKSMQQLGWSEDLKGLCIFGALAAA
jgi:hypothetical protein